MQGSHHLGFQPQQSTPNRSRLPPLLFLADFGRRGYALLRNRSSSGQSFLDARDKQMPSSLAPSMAQGHDLLARVSALAAALGVRLLGHKNARCIHRPCFAKGRRAQVRKGRGA